MFRRSPRIFQWPMQGCVLLTIESGWMRVQNLQSWCRPLSGMLVGFRNALAFAYSNIQEKLQDSRLVPNPRRLGFGLLRSL